MAAYNLSPVFNDAQLDSAGSPLTGGLLYWYLAGTTTPATTYQTNLGTPHTSPIVLNARGEPPAPIWLSDGQAYKAVLHTPSGVSVRTIDDIIGVGDTRALSSTFSSVNIDSTGNGGKIWQSASGVLSLTSNQGTGTQQTLDIKGDSVRSSAPIIAPSIKAGVDSQYGYIRPALAADTTYYVRPDGSDSNNGFTNSSAGAFLTIQRAVTAVASVDLRGFTATIQVADGLYSEPVLLERLVGNGSAVISGNIATPASVHISSASESAVSAARSNGWRITGVKVSSGGGYGIIATQSTTLNIGAIEFGACLSSCLVSDRNSSVDAAPGGTIRLSGNSPIFADALFGGTINFNGAPITLVGTRAYSSAFARALYCSIIEFSGSVITGSATGPRYSAGGCGVIVSPFGGANDLPGSIAGGIAYGGQYI